MPYVKCSNCGLRAFTVAYWLERERCGSCGAELPRPRRQADFLSEQDDLTARRGDDGDGDGAHDAARA